MAYVYSGPIGSSVNGFAAFLSGAASYFIPISLSGIIAESTFINKLNNLNQIDVFVETYGSISLNVKQLKLLNKDTQKALNVLLEKNLVKVLHLSKEGDELFETLKTFLSYGEALSLAQAIDSNANIVVVDSEDAKILAVNLGIIPISYEEFLLKAYEQGLVNSEEILKIML